jgi:hypothetical protein
MGVASPVSALDSSFIILPGIITRKFKAAGRLHPMPISSSFTTRKGQRD